MKCYNVNIDSASFDVERHRRALASLPNHFIFSSNQAADIALWSSANFSNETFTPKVVVVDQPIHMSNFASQNYTVLPAFHFLPIIHHMPRSTNLITVLEINCLLSENDNISQASCLFEMLTIARALTNEAVAIGSHVRHKNGIIVSGQTLKSATAVSISVNTSPVDGGAISINAVSKTQRFEIEFQSDQTARAGQFTLYNAGGSHQTWPVHQNSHRLTWLAAYDFASGTLPRQLYSTEDLQADCVTAKAML